jgi:6-pyruvoyltetrahydropterin/6-carboxytetrahydropterin synthase
MEKKYVVTQSIHHHFDAAHKLLLYNGKCSEMHGHRWEVEVVATLVTDLSSLMARGGILIDFMEVKEIIDYWDHTTLNDYFKHPTAEFLAMSLTEKIGELLMVPGPQVQVTVWESPDCSVTITEVPEEEEEHGQACQCQASSG